MAETKELKRGDACPNCGGEFAPLLSQQSAALVDHHKRVAANPSASARYAEQLEEKVRVAGELEACRDCGYQHRFGPAADGDDQGEPAGAGAGAGRSRSKAKS